MMQGSLATRLRILRVQQGLMIGEAADKMGIDRHTLGRVEQGTQMPHAPTLKKIAAGYGVSVEDLLQVGLVEEPVPLGEAPPLPGPAVTDTPDKARAREAIGADMEEAGFPVHYLAMPQEELLVLFGDVETVEEAKALAKGIRAERELLNKTLPNATFPGHPTHAIMGTLATAALGIRRVGERVAERVAEREMARIRAEAEEVAQALVVSA